MCDLLSFVFPVRTDAPQKHSDDTDAVSGLGPDLAASIETTYSEQSSSSAGSSSSSEQPIYFRFKIWMTSNRITIFNKMYES